MNYRVTPPTKLHTCSHHPSPTLAEVAINVPRLHFAAFFPHTLLFILQAAIAGGGGLVINETNIDAYVRLP